jgi:EVE domain
MAPGNYWIGVVSRAHAQLGVAGGFVQLGHGKRAPLQRLRAGDGIVLYSPRTAYPDGEPLQAFTAIGTVTTAEIYQVEMTPQFQPYRVDVAFQPCREAPIKPLLDDLSFVADKAHWGSALRFGQLKIGAHDFAVIARAMDCAALGEAAA